MEMTIAKYFLLRQVDTVQMQFLCTYVTQVLCHFILSLSLIYLSFLRYQYLLESQCLSTVEGRIVVAFLEHIYLGCNDRKKLFN